MWLMKFEMVLRGWMAVHAGNECVFTWTRSRKFATSRLHSSRSTFCGWPAPCRCPI